MKVRAYRYCVVLLAVGLTLAGAFWAKRARAATTFTVRLTSDAGDNNPGDGVCRTVSLPGNSCTLRAAIQEANALAGTDTIVFDIGSVSPNHEIVLNAPLPAITAPVIINGNTGGATRVDLVGLFAGANANGLTLSEGSGGSQIRSLVIRNFSGYGIEIGFSSGNTIQNNYIGTTIGGDVDAGNGFDGVRIIGGRDNLIGGTTPGTRNVISGNDMNGVHIISGSGNQVQGNFIGTNAAGTAQLGNTLDGVLVHGTSPNNTIGGTAAGAGNVISGNKLTGVAIDGNDTNGNKVQGNYIGTNAAGTAPLGNFTGIAITAPGNTIGGTEAGARNVISGNRGGGVFIGQGAVGTQVQGNYIGTNAAGTAPLGNAVGVSILNTPNNTIGGSTPAARNIISGNSSGVSISATFASGNKVQGNFIGTDVTGTVALGNVDGVQIGERAADNTIGGTEAGARNVISGNKRYGVLLSLSANNKVQGNYIGTDVNGTADLGNDTDGVLINIASNNTIGGTDADDGTEDGNVRARNVISGNNESGVKISGETANGNKVQGNYIGTDFTGTAPLGNSLFGVRIESASNNIIGGTTAGARNIISGNNSTGVSVESVTQVASSNIIQGNYIGTDVTGIVALGNNASGVAIRSALDNTVGGKLAAARNVISGNAGNGVVIATIATTVASGNQVQGNYIGTDVTGKIDLGNRIDGVFISRAANNTVGGTDAGAGNLISGNNLFGVRIAGEEARNNKVQRNLIGTDATGANPLGNSEDGVNCVVGTSNNIIGGAVGLGNTIAFNAGRGVNISGLQTTSNAVLTNSIFSNGGLGIDLNDDGVTPNDADDADEGNNNLQNFPVIKAATNGPAGDSTTVQAELNSTPNTVFTIEFFSSPAADPSGHGEGQTFRGSTAVQTDASGNAAFSMILNSVVPAGHFITTTATDSSNNTSEFSQAVQVQAASASTFNITGRVTNSQGGAGVEGVTVTLTGSRGATAQTDASGNYSFNELPTDGSYSVTPSKAGFSFDPPTRSITNPTGNVTADFVATAAATPTPTPPTLQLSQSTFSANEGLNTVGIVITRAGDPNVAVSVELQTLDDPAEVRCDAESSVAFARCDYATTVETVTWAAGDASPKTVQIPLINDAHPEGAETFRIRLSDPAGGASLGAQAEATVTVNDDGDTASTPNPIFQTQFFVRMHYLDFLSREPEALEPWSAVLNGCPDRFNLDPNSPSASCDRITVSAAFFGSPEFRMKGFFVFRFYKASFGRLPLYGEIIPDMRRVAGQTPEEVFAKKARFTNAWVQRQEFKDLYDTLSNAAFVNALMDRYQLQSVTTPDPANPDGAAKVTLARADLVGRLDSAALTRAQVVRAIADSDEVAQREFNSAFVAMQYYGYLRRTPEPTGYDAWLSYLNQNPSDFRTMVNGFVNSAEYRLRFGRP